MTSSRPTIRYKKRFSLRSENSIKSESMTSSEGLSQGSLGVWTKRLKAAMSSCSRRTLQPLTMRSLLPCLAKAFSLIALIVLWVNNPTLVQSILSEISLEDVSNTSGPG